MNAPVVAAQSGGGQDKQRIAAFAARASFEATRLEPGDLEALREGFPRETPIYVSAVPAHPLAMQIDTAARLAAAGYEPVPHIAARQARPSEIQNSGPTGRAWPPKHETASGAECNFVPIAEQLAGRRFFVYQHRLPSLQKIIAIRAS